MTRGENVISPLPRHRAAIGTHGGAMQRVFLDFDQAGLDAAYDQSVHAPNMARILQRYASLSERARERIGEPERVPYGRGAAEYLDFFSTQRRNAPLLVFVHGGAWKAGAARNYAFIAEPFLAAGAHVAIVDFSPVQELGGDLRAMAAQVHRAWAWTCRSALDFGADPARLYLAGHSSGAHLAATCLVRDWRQDGLPANCVKGALLSSGVFDLRPIRLSQRNDYIALDDAAESELSVQRHAAKVRAPVVVSYGSEESPEFVRQATEFAHAVRAGGGRAELLRGEHYNHFVILETLGNGCGLLYRALHRLMQLG
jgi:arylformamidase